MAKGKINFIFVQLFIFSYIFLTGCTAKEMEKNKKFIDLIVDDVHQEDKINKDIYISAIFKTAAYSITNIYEDAHIKLRGKEYINEKLKERDCIINRTLIDRTTNQRIGKRPPYEYLKDIERDIGKDVLNKTIVTHLMADDIKSLSKESFNGFMEHRLNIIRKNIQEVTEKSIDHSDGNFEKREYGLFLA